LTAQRTPVRAARWLALAGVVGPFLFIAAYLIAGAARPGYSLIHQAISDLGVGTNAWPLNASIIVVGLLFIAFAASFALSMRDMLSSGLRWLCAALLAFHGLGLIVAGIFTEAPATLAIHWLVGADLAFFGPVIALLVVGLAWRRQPQWRTWGNYSLATAFAIVLVTAFTFWVFAPGTPLAPEHLGGLMERVLFITIESWYVVIGWRLFSRAGS
jgi:hypothetical membrane protein